MLSKNNDEHLVQQANEEWDSKGRRRGSWRLILCFLQSSILELGQKYKWILIKDMSLDQRIYDKTSPNKTTSPINKLRNKKVLEFFFMEGSMYIHDIIKLHLI
jgi:hypothetical protein